MTVLGAIALVLQSVGLVITGLGLRYTWREFHEPGERFIDPFVRVLKQLDPRHRRDRHVEVGVAELVMTADDARVRFDFGPLPDDVRAALDLLSARIQGLRNDLEGTMSGVRGGLRDVTRRLVDLERRIGAEIDRLDRADRHVATDGLRLESIGLLIVAAGTLIQLIDGLARSTG